MDFLFDTQQIQAKFSWNLKEAMKEALRLDGQDCSSFVIWSRGWRLNNLSTEKHKEFRDKPLKIVKSHKSAGARAILLHL